MTGRALTQPELCELLPSSLASPPPSTSPSFNYSNPSTYLLHLCHLFIPYVFLARGPSTHQRTRLCTHVLLLLFLFLLFYNFKQWCSFQMWFHIDASLLFLVQSQLIVCAMYARLFNEKSSCLFLRERYIIVSVSGGHFYCFCLSKALAWPLQHIRSNVSWKVS